VAPVNSWAGKGAPGPRAYDQNDPTASPIEEGWTVSTDGTVRLRLAGGGVLEVATCPTLDVARGAGPRRAFLSPETGRRGPFVAIVEGVPAAVADLFFSHARDEIERVTASPGSSLNRAVRAGCAAVRAAARRRPDLDAFGFTTVLFESAPGPVAFVAQLPPCQLYFVDGTDVRPLPEVPTGQAAGRGRSVSERRWEVEIESVRVPLVHDARLVLVDASVPEALSDPTRLVDLARRHVGVMAGRLQSLVGNREAVVIRFARPVGTSTGIARASERVRDLVRFVGDPITMASRLFGSRVPDGDHASSVPHASTDDPTVLAALLELEATGRVPDGFARTRSRVDGPVLRRRTGIDPVTDASHTGAAVEARRNSPRSTASDEAVEPQDGRVVRRRATAPGALLGQSVPADAPWLAPARGSLVPTTFSGTPLDSARYPRATDPRGWLSRMLGPTVFLPGSRRRQSSSWLRGTVGAVITAGAVGVVVAAFRPELVELVTTKFATASPTALPAPPSPTVPPLAGKTVAQARGRFTSLAAPPNIAGDQAPTSNVRVTVLDEAGEVLTISIGSLEVTRAPLVKLSAAPPPGFVPRGLFAAGGALVPRDDGTLVFDSTGSLSLWPFNGQPARPVKVKAQAAWASPVAAVVYGSSMYVFDSGASGASQPPAGKVWRHPLTAGGNYDADAVPWLASGQTVDLTLTSDVATDGAFWVSRRDGTILRLASGKAELVELKGGSLPTRLGAIYTDQGTQSLYVVDESSRRLLRIGKDGGIGADVDAVLAPGEAARGLWVDEDAKMAVVVTTARVVVVPLPN
jgi:hypothetical protein